MGAKLSKRVLLVEGQSDRNFCLALQRRLGLGSKFDIASPSDQGKHPGKPSVTSLFDFLLEEASEPGRYEALGLMVDADFLPTDGFDATQAALAALMATRGFRKISTQTQQYRHRYSGCLASFWISPSHAGDGYLETLLLNALDAPQRAYLDGVVAPFTTSLAEPRFAVPRNLDRAKLYVFLAIQQKPDKSLPTMLDDNLLDMNKPEIAGLQRWLQGLFGVAA